MAVLIILSCYGPAFFAGCGEGGGDIGVAVEGGGHTEGEFMGAGGIGGYGSEDSESGCLIQYAVFKHEGPCRQGREVAAEALQGGTAVEHVVPSRQ